MGFFNKKEEVIDIELTRFGRSLLARGAFKPVYYQFFDDDIIYDLSYTGKEEIQNDIEQRIKDDIRLKNQYLTTGIETSYDYQSELIKQEKRGVFNQISRYSDPIENDRILKYPLGSCNLGTQTAPSFSLKSYGAPITGSLTYLHSSGEVLHTSGVINSTPQITINPEYTYIVDRTETNNTAPPVLPSSFIDLTTDVVTFTDNSKIKKHKEDLVIDVEEYSTLFGDENFEIEILKETSKGSGVFIPIDDREEIFKFFNIYVDDAIDLIELQEKDKNTNV